MVALFHFRALTHVYALDIIRNSWLFVDFFFVLSGFVISYNYLDRIRNGFSFKKFVWLRLGRIYPLHIFILLVFIAFELVLLLIPSLGALSPDGVFSSEGRSVFAIFTNIFMIDALNMHSTNTWNYPSWTISVEFYTYLIFFLLILAAARYFMAVNILIGISIPIIFLVYSDYFKERYLFLSYEWSILRCLFSFSLGVICSEIFPKIYSLVEKHGSKTIWTIVEILAVAGAYIVTANAAVHDFSAEHQVTISPISLLAPFSYSLVVLIFAFEKGAISAFMRLGPMVFLGTISYSVYMVHIFVQDRIKNVAQLLEKFFDFDVFTKNDFGVALLGAEYWQGYLATAIMLPSLIFVSYLTYNFVEKPSRNWFRERANRSSLIAKPTF